MIVLGGVTWSTISTNMEYLRNKETPYVRSYYLTEVVDDNGKKEIVVGSKPEWGVSYMTKEIIDEMGNMHIIFWKSTNSTDFEDNKRTFVFG